MTLKVLVNKIITHKAVTCNGLGNMGKRSMVPLRMPASVAREHLQ